MQKNNSNWYLIYTRPQQEKKIVSRLSEINVDTFLPLVKKVHQWNNRRKVIEAPLFPSYVFVNIKSATDFYNSKNIKGFVSYIKFNNQIAKVNQSVIDNLKIALNVCENPEVTRCGFQLGQKVLIQKGPLEGLSCEIIKYNGKSKARVRVDLLSQDLLVDIPQNLIFSLPEMRQERLFSGIVSS